MHQFVLSSRFNKLGSLAEIYWAAARCWMVILDVRVLYLVEKVANVWVVVQNRCWRLTRRLFRRSNNSFCRRLFWRKVFVVVVKVYWGFFNKKRQAELFWTPLDSQNTLIPKVDLMLSLVQEFNLTLWNLPPYNDFKFFLKFLFLCLVLYFKSIQPLLKRLKRPLGIQKTFEAWSIGLMT